ncbi:hypothetical protein VTH06DRAFT_8758 [Thermothelomyces fergusii]
MTDADDPKRVGNGNKAESTLKPIYMPQDRNPPPGRSIRTNGNPWGWCAHPPGTSAKQPLSHSSKETGKKKKKTAPTRKEGKKYVSVSDA